MELDLKNIEPCLSCPKRLHDRFTLKDMMNDWNNCLTNKIGFKRFELKPENTKNKAKFNF